MLVVGYNAFGKQIVFEAAEAHHQSRTNQKSTMALLDEFPEYKQLNNIEKTPFNIEKDSVKPVIEEQQQVCTHIFICLDEDYIDLMEEIALSAMFYTPL